MIVISRRDLKTMVQMDYLPPPFDTARTIFASSRLSIWTTFEDRWFICRRAWRREKDFPGNQSDLNNLARFNINLIIFRATVDTVELCNQNGSGEAITFSFFAKLCNIFWVIMCSVEILTQFVKFWDSLTLFEVRNQPLRSTFPTVENKEMICVMMRRFKNCFEL